MKKRKAFHRKVGFTSVVKILPTLSKMVDLEDDIYSILSRCNKKMLAELTDSNYWTLSRKIRDKTLSLKEIINLFSYIRNFSEEEYNKIKIDPNKLYRKNWY